MGRDLTNHATRLVRIAARQPFLKRDEELRLARKAGAGDFEAAGRLILSHMRVVIKVARGYRGSGLPMSDLIQQGTLGLIHAVQKFNPEKGVRLSTYGAWWIRASIQDHVVRSWSVVRVGTTNAQKALFLRLRRMTAEFLDGTEGLSDDLIGKLAKRFDTTASEVRSLARRMAGGGDQSLDRTLVSAGPAGSGPRSLLESIPSPAPTPEEDVAEASERRFFTEIVTLALGKLPPRERLIIQRRYLAEAKHTFDSIGREIGLSKDRVRQLERAAMDKLREVLQPALREHLWS